MRPLLDVGALMYVDLGKMMFALRLFDLVFQRLSSTEFNYFQSNTVIEFVHLK